MVITDLLSPFLVVPVHGDFVVENEWPCRFMAVVAVVIGMELLKSQVLERAVFGGCLISELLDRLLLAHVSSTSSR